MQLKQLSPWRRRLLLCAVVGNLLSMAVNTLVAAHTHQKLQELERTARALTLAMALRSSCTATWPL
jgi:type II secretory pathway component PulL